MENIANLMKIFYVTNARLPTEKAHGLATIKLCEAFAKEGIEVTVFCPWRVNPVRGKPPPAAAAPSVRASNGVNPLKQDLYGYYRVQRNFKVCFLPSFDFLWLGFGKRFFFLLQLFSFSNIAAIWLFFRYGISGQLRNTVIFSHDHIPLFFVSFFASKIFYDIHHYPEDTLLYRRVLERAIGIGVQTRWKIQKLHEDFGVPAEKIVYWPNGTDIERFDIRPSVKEARAQLNLPQDKRVVLYTGSLQRWKGVEILLEASQFLSPEVVVYIVGGSEEEIQKFKIQNSKFKIRFVGHRPWAEIPLWLKAADVLVLPNTGRMRVSQYYTSPMKLFEYMASGRPIVASDIPSIREIVDETMVFFATADDPESFAQVIQQTLNRPGEARSRVEKSLAEVKKYTWDNRATRLLEPMHKL